MRFHHDIAVTENGDIYVLAREDDFSSDLPAPILHDYIIVLSQDGEIKEKISLFKVLKNEIPPQRFSRIRHWLIKHKGLIEEAKQKKKDYFIFKKLTPPDVFHTNTIKIIDRDIGGFCKRGDLLISFRTLDLIGILDLDKEKLIWKWGWGELRRPHNPTILENGNILIFDNGGPKRIYSRIVVPC